MPIIQTQGCLCAICGHVWIPSQWRKSEDMPLPGWCANCKSALWNRETNGKPKVKPKVEEVIAPEPEPEPYEPDEPVAMQAPIGAAEIERIEEEEAPVNPPPKKRQRRANPEEKKVTKLGVNRCPHGFFVVDGATRCPQCKTGK